MGQVLNFFRSFRFLFHYKLGKCDIREVEATFGTHYPNMIHAAKPGTTKKLSGGFKPAVKVMNLNDLASNLTDRVSDKPIKSNWVRFMSKFF